MIKKIVIIIFVFCTYINLYTQFNNNIYSKNEQYYYYKGAKIPIKDDQNEICYIFKNKINNDLLSSFIKKYSQTLNVSKITFFKNTNFIVEKRIKDLSTFTQINKEFNNDSLFLSLSPTYFIGNSKVYITNQIIFKKLNNIEERTILDFLKKYNPKIVERYNIGIFEKDLLEITQNINSIVVANLLVENNLVEFAEPVFYTPIQKQDSHQYSKSTKNFVQSNYDKGNYKTRNIEKDNILDLPNDPYFQNGNQVFLYHDDVVRSWILTTGSDQILIAIFDDGFDLTHEEFINSYGDKKFEHQYNAIDDNYDVNPDGAEHGTNMAGIIGAFTNNGLGIVSIGYNCKFVPIKTHTDYAEPNQITMGRTENYLLNPSSPGYGLNIVSIDCSWKMSTSSTAVETSLENIRTGLRNNLGASLVFASGNDDADNIDYPGNTVPCIVVGAARTWIINPPDPTYFATERWEDCFLGNCVGSNYGSKLDLMAVGVGIWTTKISSGEKYQLLSGNTSIAAAIVSGAIGLMASYNPDYSRDQLEDILLRHGCQKFGDYDYNQPGPYGIGGWNNEMGYGLLGVAGAVSYVDPKCLYIMGPLTLSGGDHEFSGANCIQVPYNSQIVEIMPNTNVIFHSGQDIIFSAPFSAYEGCSLDAYISNQNVQTYNVRKKTNYFLKTSSFNKQFDSNYVKNKDNLPVSFSLYQNYPNPFNPSTTIKFDIPKESFIIFNIFDITGKKVYEIQNYYQQGTYNINFEASNLASGVYFYTLHSKDFNKTLKMLLIK